MNASLTSLTSVLAASLALGGCSGSPSPSASGPDYPACSAPLDAVFTSPGLPGVVSAPQELVAIGETLYFFTPSSEASYPREGAPPYPVDLQSITPWGEEVTVASYLLPTSGLFTDGTSLHWLTATGLATQVPGGPLGEVPSLVARSSLIPSPFTSDDTAIYAIETAPGGVLSLDSETFATGADAKIASLPSLASPVLFDAGDRVAVVDGVDVYLVSKSGGTVTHETLPAGVTAWNADATGLYVVGANGIVQKYAYGGALTTLWSSGTLNAIPETKAIGPDGTLLLSVSVIRDEQLYGLAFAVGEPNQVASFTDCTAPEQQFRAPLVTSSAIYGVVTPATVSSDWQLVRIPR